MLGHERSSSHKESPPFRECIFRAAILSPGDAPMRSGPHHRLNIGTGRQSLIIANAAQVAVASQL